MLDVDHFKRVNDTYGHAIGDEVLRELVNALNETVRAGDLVGRWGGEEFILLLREVPPAFHARNVDRILQAVQQLRVDGIPKITVSVGGAVLSERTTVEDLIQLADQRLYEAKSAGRNRAVLRQERSSSFPPDPTVPE